MSNQFPRTTLFGTEERTLFCSAVNREYHLSVILPYGYENSDQTYPVIYLLDADLYTGMASALTQLNHWFSKAPNAIVVGISYGMETNDEWVALRELDFNVPEIPDAPPNSVANHFLDALTEEMIPFIESNYRTKPNDRCLYGYSASGFFVLYALFHRPDAFQRYISGSGGLFLGVPYLLQHGEHLAAHDPSNPIQLYLSVGELEDNQFPYFDQLLDFLKRGNYPNLTVTQEIYPNEGHGSEGSALSYLHGLRSVYSEAERTPSVPDSAE